ncbi:MAG: bifunctional prephenate dehydrogenase/3-phosphoshikimate 1-carboxyvinyltransferase [Pseudohongiellaceae bacterium]
MKKLPDTLLIVGLGLMGGSVARAVRARGLCRRILACDRDAAGLAAAIDAGVIDEGGSDLAALAGEADLVLIAVPVLSVGAVLRVVVEYGRPEVVITDVASVKGQVSREAVEVLGPMAPRFVPGHPIAGSEESGFNAARDGLFQQRKVIITPGADTDADAVRRVTAFWHALGADVHGMSVTRHDAVLAATSHLPHLLAYTLINTLARSAGNTGQEETRQVFDYAAGGFAGFTRIASSDPTMWRDIFLSNGPATLNVLDRFRDELDRMREHIRTGKGDALQQYFSRARQARDHFIRRFEATGETGNVMHSARVDYVAGPGGCVTGDCRVPGDKSISHRSIMFGALAEGVTKISGFLEGEDSLHTLQAFRDMGVPIVGPEEGEVTVYGVGMHGLAAPREAIWLGNSGTAMRLLTGLLAAQSFDSELTGDASLSARPMERVAGPLRRMGASIDTAEGGRPPLRIHGSGLTGIRYEMPMASAQVKSCLLLAGLYADGETTVVEPEPCRDHTERMLRGFGCRVEKSDDGRTTSLRGDQSLQAADIDVPADISSAAFFMVAASIAPGSDLLLRHVGVNPTRTGIIDLLRLMGADITLENEHEAGGEPVADVRVRHAALHGIEVPGHLIPLAIDEFPVLFVAAACASGDTVLHGAEELRVKETDRIQVMADGLTALGVSLETHDDGIRISGGKIGGGEVDSAGDHRVAMSFAVASLVATDRIVIRDCANVATSFPGFVPLAGRVGLTIQTREA